MKSKWIILGLAAAAVCSAGAILLQRAAPPPAAVRITRDGVILAELRLDQVEEGYLLPLEDRRGRNTVQVEPGRIRVLEADCPDQVCVGRGWLSDQPTPIVCLPHRLVIQLVDGEGELDGGAG